MPRISNSRTRAQKRNATAKQPTALILPGLRIGAFLAVIGFSLYLYTSSDAQNYINSYKLKFVATISNSLQLKVKRITIIGARQTTKQEISQALGFKTNDPMLLVDLERAHDALQKLEWMKHVEIVREFPTTIKVRLTERTPLALWQHKKNLTLIDKSGAPINIPTIKGFHHLPHILGEQAPENADKFLRQLDNHPEITKNLVACVFIDKRRWNLILQGKIHVKLPEDKVSQALKHLEKLLKDGYISDGNVLSVDLRIPDRTYFQLTPKAYLAQTKRTGSYT